MVIGGRGKFTSHDQESQRRKALDKSGVIIQGCQSSGHQLGLLPDAKGAGDSTACEGLGCSPWLHLRETTGGLLGFGRKESS